MKLLFLWILFIILMSIGALEWIDKWEYLFFGSVMLYLTYLLNNIDNN